MGSFRIFSLVILGVALSLAVRAADPVPAGYVVNLSAQNADQTVLASCQRAEQTLNANDGFVVLAGDVITGGAGKTLVAFVDGSCATLDQGAKLKINEYAYPSRRCPTTVSVETGKAFFCVTPRPEDAHFMVHMRDNVVEVKGTKFMVFTQWNAATQTYTDTVAVTQSSVTLTANGTKAVNILAGTQVALTCYTTHVTGYSGANVTLQQNNLSKDQIKALEAGSVTVADVSVGSNGSVTVKSTITNADGSVTTTDVTETNGVASKVQSSTKSGKTTTDKITESSSKTTISETIGTLAISEDVSGGTGTATIKDSSDKDSYKGTVSSISGGTKVVTTDKSGNSIVVVTRYLADGTKVVAVTKFAASATTGTETITSTSPTGVATVTTEKVTTTWASTDFTLVPNTQTVANPVQPSRPAAPSVSSPGTPNPADPLNPAPVSR